MEEFRDTGQPLQSVNEVIVETARRLYFGEPDGEGGGFSPFAAVVIVGVFHVVDRGSGTRGLRTNGAAQFNKDFPEARGKLIAKLREIISDLEDIERSSKQVPT